jgi:hypothetical protein
VPARPSARPFKLSFSPSIIGMPCARPISPASVAPIPAWRLDRGQFVEVEFEVDNRLKRFRSRGFAQRVWQSVETRGAIGLDVDQFAHGVAPTSNVAATINRPARADHDRWRWSLMFRPPPGLPLSVAQRCLAFGLSASWHGFSPLRVRQAKLTRSSRWKTGAGQA